VFRTRYLVAEFVRGQAPIRARIRMPETADGRAANRDYGM
jgi:hypothetical protein